MKYDTIYKKALDCPLPPLEILRRIKGEKMPFFLDSAKGDAQLGTKSYLGCNPRKTLKSRKSQVIIEGEEEKKVTAQDPLAVLRELLKEYPVGNDQEGFNGGAVGCLSYDFTAHNLGIDFRNERPEEVWDLFFGIYTSVLEYDTDTKRYTLHYMTKEEADFWEDLIQKDVPGDPKPENEKRTSGVMFPEEVFYQRGFAKIKEHIRKGDVYEVNLSQFFEARDSADPFTEYCLLRDLNPADFMAYMDFGEYQALSSSPERFFECKGRIVTTRPIKGTIPRGETEEKDKEQRDRLLSSEKDISELLMIVDLMRNDLALSCDYESIKVDEMYRLETYTKVHHLVSTIEGRLRDEEDALSLMRNIFPGGSITGAPKRASIEVIEETEVFSRGIYTGSLGYFSFNGNADFNILIRTILKKGDKCYFYGGGAITWDSDEECENEEVFAKCRPIIKLFSSLDEDMD